jgi:hypothetical protein
MRPNFESYSYSQLLQSFHNVNREKYPERFEVILSELKKKKPINVKIIKVRSGYRIIEEGKIPKKLGADHKVKSIGFSTDSKEYRSTFLKTTLALIPIIIAVLVRIWTTDWILKNEIALALIVLVIFGSIVAYFFRKSEGEEVIFTFYDEYIEEKRGSKTNIFYLNELRDINSQEATNAYNPIDMITLKFENNRKLSFSSFEPKFSEIKSYLKRYLSNRLDYKLFMDSDSEF